MMIHFHLTRSSEVDFLAIRLHQLYNIHSGDLCRATSCLVFSTFVHLNRIIIYDKPLAKVQHIRLKHLYRVEAHCSVTL